MIAFRSVETWWEVEGLDVLIYLERRPPYCDRGEYSAKICVKAGGDYLRAGLDAQDGWPRYYFDWDRMLLEIEAWLVKRKQLL